MKLPSIEELIRAIADENLDLLRKFARIILRERQWHC